MGFESCQKPGDLEAFNRQLVWFAPKGVRDDDKKAVYRGPSQLRTIFGSNCDSKIVSGTIANKLTPATLAITPDIQRGFCRGRQLAMNVVDLDAYTRVFNTLHGWEQHCGDVKDLPGTALYDFCNAFPTLLHEWLFYVLKAIRCPKSYRNVIQAMYTRIMAFSSGIGECAFLFFVLGGVKTGCPLSSMLFLLGVNPIIHLFIWLSDGPKLSVTRVCADDFGSALKTLSALKNQAAIFRAASGITGLHLKTSKCVLIISCVELSDFV